ncbi:MAG TPA: RNA methyltransferase [Edaphocola sp.]|nr:RNA methyltransferase [Edaphocola sp.]
MSYQLISNIQIKHFRSLHQQKFRKEQQQYLVEGVKNVEEWILEGADIEYVIAIKEWFDAYPHLLKEIDADKCLLISEKDLPRLSGMKNPNQVVLVVNITQSKKLSEIKSSNWSLMLDRVQDPGNLGTIIRTADWFGIENIICSNDTAEQYNPKVIQATMGSLLRVNCFYTDLPEFLKQNSNIPVYAALLDGSPLMEYNSFSPGLIVMGNESKGISEEVKALVQHRLFIPRIGKAESLNVAVATGIFCNALISKNS